MLHPRPLSQGAPPHSWRDTEARCGAPPPLPGQTWHKHCRQPEPTPRGGKQNVGLGLWGQEGRGEPRPSLSQLRGPGMWLSDSGPQPPTGPRWPLTAGLGSSRRSARCLQSPPLTASYVCETNTTIKRMWMEAGNVWTAHLGERPGRGRAGVGGETCGAEKHPEPEAAHLPGDSGPGDGPPAPPPAALHILGDTPPAAAVKPPAERMNLAGGSGAASQKVL